ncbi:uncharacterized protein [Rutidosis leptorrhynchoides]|uniref:uncharacterized protein isoform X1 n=1 Tax=Rutidosis leptorrhynchoides TaxID=125765 RepID=UPI003A99F481
MEKTAAANAMEWSIHLEKSLRSNNPGKRIEAIKEVGARLEWWSKEPELSMAEYDMFGSVPEEDKLFANAILLRLTDTFTSGDKHTKLCIVKIFMSEMKHRNKKKKIDTKNKGILSRYKVENHLELLRRIKVCFNAGDEDVRALSLALFGCWSDFAKDNADIRYLILSSIVSCNVLEVKASLFAAGCFCEFSDDFSRVLIEILVNMVSSSDMPIAGRLAGVRAFAKLRSSIAISTKAYEEGRKVLLGSVEDYIVMTMLTSLSIIASRSALLIPRQVDLLLSFLRQDKSMSQQATSLRCLRIVLSKSCFRFSPPTELISVFFNMLNDELSSVMQRDALHILYEILMSKMLSMNHSEINECFVKILSVVENLTKSPLVSTRLFAVHFLTNISVKFTRRIGMQYNNDDNAPAFQAISFVIGRLTLLTNSVLSVNELDIELDIELEQEIQTLFKTTNLMLNECPDIGEFALNKLYRFTNCLLNKDSQTFRSKLAVNVSKVVVVCLKNMVRNGTLTSQIKDVVKLLIKDVCECSYFDYYVHNVYYLLFHTVPIEERGSDQAYMITNEILALENAKKLIEKKNYWSTYKFAKYAVFQGAWFTAAFSFGELIKTVNSDSCQQWLTSLTLFAYSEVKILYRGLPKERSVLLDWLVKNRSDLTILGVLGEVGNSKNAEFENLDGVCKILRVSKELLSVDDVTVRGKHYFQIRFLSLRANVLENVVHLFNLLHKNFSNYHDVSFVETLTQLSTRLTKLAQEYDLVATSFIGMDPADTMIVSAHALSCSVLAFVTGFSFFFANLHFGDGLRNNFYAELINDLVRRVWCIDDESSKKLASLQKTSFGQTKSCAGQTSKTQRLENTYEVRSIVKICRLGVNGVVGLQGAAKMMRENDDTVRLQIINDGLKLQLDVLRNWLNIFVRTPTYFFSVRPCVSCQLFTINRDSANNEKIMVLRGYHLHLDLCLQLNDILHESKSQLTKLYCILQCKSCYQYPSQSGNSKSQTPMEFHDWTDDNILGLDAKIFKHVNNCEKDDIFDREVAETIVCFRPNGNGQGFASCMLDVSMFPLGCYEIKWRAGCLDVNGCYWSLNSFNSGPVFTVQ